MDRPENSVILADALLTFLEDTYNEDVDCVKDSYYWFIAITHVLFGYRNMSIRYCIENIKINDMIYRYTDLLEKLRKDFKI